MAQYFYPAEEKPHEGTWLIWPHRYSYGKEYQNALEGIWLEMVLALSPGENIHIIAYNSEEETRIKQLLTAEKADMRKIDFLIAQTDDVWVRDTGPLFVYGMDKQLHIAGFGFDGWGGKAPYRQDASLAKTIAASKGFPLLPLSGFVLEGGAVEVDGEGTAMLCKSSVVSQNRNTNASIRQAEEYLARYFGIKNFIWLEGVLGEDITDAHIDGSARLVSAEILLTLSKPDFMNLYAGVAPADYDALLSARNAAGIPYKIVTLPMTEKNVPGLDYKGSYLNYYVGNRVVLLPIYGDLNDKLAEEILAGLYPGRTIVPIDVTELYSYGGMLHCITQQQPSA